MKAPRRLFGCKIRLSHPELQLEKLCDIFLFGRRGHLFDYSSAVVIYEMCVQEPMATVSPHIFYFTTGYKINNDGQL